MNPLRILLALALLPGAELSAASSQDIVKVGSGSYRVGLPADAARPCDRDGRAVAPHLSEGFAGHAPTSEFYSSLAWCRNPETPCGQPMYAHPIALQAHPDGLGLVYVQDPVVARNGYAYRMTARNEALRISIEGLEVRSPVIESVGDWTTTAAWCGEERTLRASFGHGLPFVYVHTEGGAAVVRCNPALDEPTVLSHAGPVVSVSIGESTYGLFAPEGAEWTLEDGVFRSDLGGRGLFSVAALPDASPETLATFARHALTFVVGSRVDWSYDESNGVVRATFELETEAHGPAEVALPPLLSLFRHQWLHARELEYLAPSYESARGEMKLLAASRFELELPFTGVLPTLPRAEALDRDSVVQSLDDLLAEGDLARRADIYWSGKSFGRMAQLIQVADRFGHIDARDRIVASLREELEDWFTAGSDDERFLAYDEEWSALIAYPDSYGSALELNDHHFHYGYLVLAAATVAQFDPEWASPERFGGIVELLIRDVASPDHDDELFPFLRHMDPYAGFSLASGHQDFIDGNNQESSSESMNFAAGVVLWGATTKNRELLELGVFLHALESLAIEQYWFDVDDAVFPEGMQRPSAGIVWENGAQYRTWFSNEPGAIHGIQLLPIHAGSLYLGRNPGYIARNLSALRDEKPGAEYYWRDIIWAFEALADGDKARTAIARNASYEPEAGFSHAAARHWIHSLAELGPLDSTVTGDVATCAVFRKGDDRTYVAYNLLEAPRIVTFSDGHRMEVAARSLHHETRAVGKAD